MGNNPIGFTDPSGLARGDFWDPRTYWIYSGEAREIADQVRYEEAPATNLPGALNGPQDAWRHARWNQRMVEELGLPTALIVGYGHELEEIFIQPFDQLIMDLHNNREGRRIANTNITPRNLLSEERLRTIKPLCSGGGLY